MKKIGAGILVLLLKLGPKFFSLFIKLIKSAKIVKGALATGTFIGYAYMFNWQFALLILVSIFIHEMGHIYAMKKIGMKTKGIYFIPFLGAAAVADDMFKQRKDECYVALMGPIWGLGTAIILAGIYFFTKINFFGGAAAWVALVNLFNLLPVNPLDGGRVFKSVVISIHSWVGLFLLGLTVVVCILLAVKTGMGIFAFLGIIGFLDFLVERWRIRNVSKRMLRNMEKYTAYKLDGNEVEADISMTLLKKDLPNMPPVKLEYKEMAMYTAIYLGLTVIMWSLMILMSHIPGVDMAMKMLAQ